MLLLSPPISSFAFALLTLPHPTGWGNEQAAVWCLAADQGQPTTMGEKKKKQQKKGHAETYLRF